MKERMPSGITFTTEEGDTIPIEEHLQREEDKKKQKEVDGEVLESQNISVYRKPRGLSGKGSRGVLHTKLFTQKEINKMDWHNHLKRAVADNNLQTAVLAVLLRQEPMALTQWTEYIWHEDLQEKHFTKSVVKHRVTYTANKSPIGNLLEVTREKGKNRNIYILCDAAKNLSLFELETLYYKKNPPELKIPIYQKHPGIEDLIEDEKAGPKKVTPTERKTDKAPVEDAVIEVKSTINRMLSDRLGVDVSGKVDINVNINFKIT